MLRNWPALLAVSSALAVLPLQAAELFYMDHDTLTRHYVGAVGPLVLSGEIVPGDYDRLLTRIAADEARFFKQNQIIVASEEGDVVEALRIAQLVRTLYSQVTVGPLTGRCAGPCFLIYAAASQRATDGTRLIGVRRLPGVDKFLEDNAVPAALVMELNRHATEVYWLTEADEKSLGSRSPAFIHYLKTTCGWDEAVERDVYAGLRPFADMNALFACRTRVTRAAAHQALATALAARAASH